MVTLNNSPNNNATTFAGTRIVASRSANPHLEMESTMENYTTTQGAFDKLLNAKEISAFLNVSKPQAFLMIRRGDFPVVRMGRLVRVRQSDLEEYINNQISPSKHSPKNLVWGITKESGD